MDDTRPGLREWAATSRSGAISVRTTEQGLPLGISIEAAELRRDPQGLAAEVLRLCKQAANRAGMARRAELAAAGVPADMLALTGLPTAEDVASQEFVEEQEYETEPDSWLREV
ncbi:hypothetical protein OG874_40315 [Nocardia sp. NBC_00565]|uniref:hypothetical protein n=1 Tax=Nocardia sp. NBC_00565 TaxID=2975993 RepID=UPI002E7FB64F|nr:hypothetical protein [Nocardia sp. NBC_00565]WUC02872.1 hypothetical protein OG874_40315 [Nocardia sp. NBC_00565]